MALPVFLFFSGCDLLNNKPEIDLKKKIDETIAWANAPRLTVNVHYPVEWGQSPQAGRLNPDETRRGYAFNVEFTTDPAYGFVEWRACRAGDYKGKATDAFLDGGAVVIQRRQEGAVSVIVNIVEDISLVPWCEERPAVKDSNLPMGIDNRIFINVPIKIVFSKPMNLSDFIDTGNDALSNGNIVITGLDRNAAAGTESENLNKYYTVGGFSENNTLLTLPVNPDNDYMHMRNYNLTITISGRVRAQGAYNIEMGRDVVLNCRLSHEADAEAPVISLLDWTLSPNSPVQLYSGTDNPFVLNTGGRRMVYLLFMANDNVGIKSAVITENTLAPQTFDGLEPYTGQELKNLADKYKLAHSGIVPYILSYPLQTGADAQVNLKLQVSDGINISTEEAAAVRLDLTPPPAPTLTLNYNGNHDGSGGRTITASWTGTETSDTPLASGHGETRIEWAQTGASTGAETAGETESSFTIDRFDSSGSAIPLPFGLYTVTIRTADKTGNLSPAVSVVTAVSQSNLYVKESGTGDGTSWPDASGDLQLMMDMAREGAKTWPDKNIRVHVGAGTYNPRYWISPSGACVASAPTEQTGRDRVFTLRQGVMVLGGYDADGNAAGGTRESAFHIDSTDAHGYGEPKAEAHRAVLSGDFNGNDAVSGSGANLSITGNEENAYHVVIGASLTNDGKTGLDGFTIKGANANGSGSTQAGSRNVCGGIRNNTASPVLKNLTITENSASYDGAIANYDSSPVLTNVTIKWNSTDGSGAMTNGSSTSPVLTNVLITGNKTKTNGGGMYNSGSSPGLTDVIISGNSAGGNGGGMYNSASSSPVLSNVIILGNRANGGGGGMVNSSSSPVLTDVIISGNSAGSNGGGMHNDSSSPVLTNVTITENNAVGNGGGINNYNAAPVLNNVTISGNNSSTGGGMLNSASSFPVLINVTISGNSTTAHGGGMFNNSSSPVFINATITGNSTTGSSGAAGGGIHNYNFSSPVLINVLIAGNKVSNEVGGGMHNNQTSEPVLVNVTIAGNNAVTGGGINNINSSSPKIYNSIIYANSSGITGTNTVSYSIVQGGYTGTSNSSSDPLFVTSPSYTNAPFPSGLTYNYRLSSTSSPARNNGNNNSYPVTSGGEWNALSPAYTAINGMTALSAEVKDQIRLALAKDLGGSSRYNGIIDRGAYEY
jgi:hypothetical protein